MEPTLWEGDRLLVEPMPTDAPVFRTGELIVFRDPEKPGRWLVKRVAAVGPGRFWLFRDHLDPVGGEAESLEGQPPNGAVEVVELREDSLFVLADRLAGSRDSRRFGPIPVALVVGRVKMPPGPPGR